MGKRFYDGDGLLLRRHFRDEWQATMTNPVTGRSATYLQTDRILHDLAVPGDNTTGTEEITTRLRVVDDAGSTVFVDAGRTVIREADGSIEFQAGEARVLFGLEHVVHRPALDGPRLPGGRPRVPRWAPRRSLDCDAGMAGTGGGP